MTAVYHSLANSEFMQNWAGTGAIDANDDWSQIPSIIGYRTGDVTGATAVDARTIVTDAGFIPNVLANQFPTTTTGGVSEVDRVSGGGTIDPTIALQGSNGNDYAAIVLNLDATGRKDVTFSAKIRDLDASADNAAQQVVVQYRIGSSGTWTNVAYFADVTTAGSATQVTDVLVTLPADANNQGQVQIRILTTNAAGNDELIGIDDIRVSSVESGAVVPDKAGEFSIGDAVVTEGDSGTTPITFTVTRGADSNVAAAVTYMVNLPAGATGASASDFAASALTGTLTFAQGEFSKTVTLNVAGDLTNEADETFTVTLSAPTNGATLADGSGAGTILNDDAPAGPGVPFINEIHYDNVSGDTGEAIEIAGPVGTDLTGWSLALYSVTSGATQGALYATIALSGIITDQDDGYGTRSFAVSGLQNGPLDGFALVAPDGKVVQFLSYEGSFTALPGSGPAGGMTTTDIGVSEDPPVAAGFSLQLTGSGASAADFTWVAARDDNFGSVNTGQDFIGATATGLVSVGDTSVVEGDNGVKMLVFTVTRAGGLGSAAGVDWFLSLLAGGADSADLGAGQPFSGHVDFAIGVSSVQVAIAIQGDTVGEGNERLNLLLANPSGNIAIADASAVGTILNDDPIARTISQIQGEGHATAYAGQPVVTTGIVTGVVGNGFYLQDPTGDGNDRTSDAILVFTGSAPTVKVGDAVTVQGTPTEFVPGANSLSITELVASNANVTVTSSNNALPAAVLIGTGGRTPPTQAIEDDGFSSYDPATDGLDFYESMEGMRVTVDSPIAVSNTTNFGETWVLASGGEGATGFNGRTGITVSQGDFNPERIQIDATSALFAGYTPNHSMGDLLGDVTGIMSYGFNSYELLVTEAVTVVSDVTAPRETTTLEGGRDHLTVASYNVENLDPNDAPIKFDLLAKNIVYNLAAPDIIGLQEIQDANGLNGSDPLSGVVTAQKLIDAIAAMGGPNYVYVEVAPSSEGSTGGEPGGNIRNGFLYNADRVSYVAGSAQLIDAPAFNGSRKPLVADFSFNGETVRLINVHFTSRLGSDELMGATQPPSDAGDSARTAQAAAVAAYVNNALATDPALKLGVLGDFNGFYFEGAVGTLEAAGLYDLHRSLEVGERYSYLFDGNLQAIDHMLVSGGLKSGAMFDAVHINAEQTSGTPRGTDHDPILGRFFIEHENEAPQNLVLDNSSVKENAPAGTLVGTAKAGDPDPEDVLTYSLVDNAGGRFAIDAATGALTTTVALDHEAQASFDIVIRATDPAGLSVNKTVTIAVADVNEAPIASGDKLGVAEDGTIANLVPTLLGNDSDPDGDLLRVEGVNTAGTLGTVTFDAATQTLSYSADNDRFDWLLTGATIVDRFSYTVTDAAGLTSTATVEITVTGTADGIRVSAGNGKSDLPGTGGEDHLVGGNGNDVLRGLAGHDWLEGGNGSDALFGGVGQDILLGGNGNDILDGGAGADLFVFARGGGNDTIVGWEMGVDRLVLDGVGIKSSRIGDVDGDGIADLTIAFTNGGGSVVLLGVDSITGIGFAQPEILGTHPAF